MAVTTRWSLINSPGSESELKATLFIEETGNTKLQLPVVTAIRAGAAEGGWSHCDIISGAGHDAVNLNEVCPAGMIFIPCENGISHNPAERITPEQAHAGVDVLLRAALKLANR